MNGQALLTRITSDLTQTSRTMRTAVLNSRNALWVKVRGKLEPISAKETEIKVSPRFNVHEKRHRLTTLSRDLDGAVSMLQTERDEATAKLQRLRAMLANVPAPTGDPVVNAIRAAETRNVLRTMPEGERVQVYLQAAERGNADTVHLFVNAPLPLLPEATRTEGLHVYHRSFSSVTWEAAQDAQQWCEHVSSLHEHLGAYVEALQTGSDLK